MTTANAMAPLLALRDRLATVTGVVTCQIGIEANMTAEDYPMVRIVPSRASHAAVLGRRQVEVLVYFGSPIHEFSGGQEALYTAIFALERLLINSAETGTGYYFDYRETIADEDRVDGYKLMAIRAMVEA